MKEWRPQLSLEAWFKIYPLLRTSYPLACLCGQQIAEAFPFVMGDWVGIEGKQCICGRPAPFSVKPRSKELQNFLIEAVTTI